MLWLVEVLLIVYGAVSLTFENWWISSLIFELTGLGFRTAPGACFEDYHRVFNNILEVSNLITRPMKLKLSKTQKKIGKWNPSNVLKKLLFEIRYIISSLQLQDNSFSAHQKEHLRFLCFSVSMILTDVTHQFSVTLSVEELRPKNVVNQNLNFKTRIVYGQVNVYFKLDADYCLQKGSSKFKVSVNLER